MSNPKPKAFDPTRSPVFILVSLPVLGLVYLVLRALLYALGLAYWLAGALAAVAVAYALVYGRERLDRPRTARVAPEAEEEEAPDFRNIVGDFSAATRESLDVPSIAEAFMTAVDEALHPAYQVIQVKGEDGSYQLLCSRRMADPEGWQDAAPREDEVRIPLRVGEKAICRLALGPRPGNAEYLPADYALLDSLGQSLALSVRNAQLFQQLVGQERLKRELEIAFEVQMGLLPKQIPAGLTRLVAANCTPALEVGGDFYDFVQIDANRWGLLIGDVAGKGVPAALMMAVSLTLFRALAPGVPSPSSTLGRLNKLIHRNRPSNKIFVAAIYMIYDQRDGTVVIANAGHPMPLLDGEPVAIKGLPLGVNARITYKEAKVKLETGSTLVAYSDGLEDVESEGGEQYGQDRVIAFFRQRTRMQPGELHAAMSTELADFAGKALPADDQTVIILQHQGDVTAPPPLAPRAATASPHRDTTPFTS